MSPHREYPPRSDKSPSRLTIPSCSRRRIPPSFARPPAPCNCGLVRDIKGVGHQGVIDDGKGASEGCLASSISRIGRVLRSAPNTYKHEGKRGVPPLKGNVFIDTHMGTHRSPGARKVVHRPPTSVERREREWWKD